MILGADLHSDLDILSIVSEHFLQDLDGLVIGEFADEGHDPFLVQHMDIQTNTLNVFKLLVVLQGLLVEAFLLAEHRYFLSVELVPDLHVQDGFRHLRGSHQIQFQDLGLPLGIFRLVLLHAFQQELGQFSQAVVSQEDISQLMDILALLLASLNGHLHGPLWVLGDHGGEHLNIVQGAPHGLLLLHSQVHLAGLHVALHQFFLGVAGFVNSECQLHVLLFHKVAQGFRASQLIFIEPILNELFLLLLQHGLHQLDAFLLIQLALLQEGLEIDHDGLGLARGGFNVLQLVHGVRCTEDRASGGDLGSFLVVLGDQGSVEGLLEELVGAWQPVFSGQLGAHGLVELGTLVHEIGNEVLLVNGDSDEGA